MHKKTSKGYKNKYISLAIVINLGLVATAMYTDAILVSDVKRSIYENALAFLYLPQTVLFAIIHQAIFDKLNPGIRDNIILLFISGFPVSMLYAIMMKNVYKYLIKLKNTKR